VRPNRVREKLAAGELVVSAWVSSGDPYSAEVLAHSGFDAVTVDLQHGLFGVTEAVRCLQAISTSAAVPLVRCRSRDAADIGHLLDAGAYGVICPSIDSADDARAFVAACRYPPRGRRSFGPARGLLYGGADYPVHADDTVLAIGMIESAAALAHLDEILAVPGLDAVYVGPADLSIDCGFPPLTSATSAELAVALQRIAEAADAAGVPCGAFALTAEQGREFAGWGYRLITAGNDMAMLRAEAARRLAVLRAAP
jgi:4-hydroxy-2-oxoheptanedioate aldolase